MNKEKDFFKTCFNTVASLEVANESQAIAKEVVLNEIESLQQENKQLKNNRNKLKEYIKEEGFEINTREYGSLDVISKDVIIEKMQEQEQGSDE